MALSITGDRWEELEHSAVEQQTLTCDLEGLFLSSTWRIVYRDIGVDGRRHESRGLGLWLEQR